MLLMVAPPVAESSFYGASDVANADSKAMQGWFGLLA